MKFVTIPFDYDEKSAAIQAAIVPICVARNDLEGKPIAWEWFEALSRIPERMISLARRYLDDVWRASELSEGALHKIWRLHGHDFGRNPERRLYAQALWHARDLQAGTWRERRGVVRALEGLEHSLRERALTDWRESHQVYQGWLDFNILGRRLADEGLHDVSAMLDLLLDGCTWDEVGKRLGRSGDAARMKFHRKTAGIVACGRPR
jgi:hypothetical protein